MNYLDVAPPFSGTVMGIGNTISSLAGFLSPYVTAQIVREVRIFFHFQKTHKIKELINSRLFFKNPNIFRKIAKMIQIN